MKRVDYNTYVLIKGITMVELGYFIEDLNKHSSKKRHTDGSQILGKMLNITNYCVHAQSLSCVQLCVTLWTHGNTSGSSVHGIIPARILERVAISSPRGSS